MCHVTLKCISIHSFALSVVYSLCITDKNLHKAQDWRMNMRISAWVKAPLFFHETCESYTKPATKAVMRHINHSKPYSFKISKAVGEDTFVAFHFSLGLHTIHNPLQCFIKAFNSPPADTHTWKNINLSDSYLTVVWYDLISRYQHIWLSHTAGI